MAVEREFGILGPLEARRGASPVPLPAGKQRVLLAALLINAGWRVSLPDLIARLWVVPPGDALRTVHNYVYRLRKALDDPAGDLIRTRPDGYLIEVPDSAVDLHRFTELVAWAQRAGEPAAAPRSGKRWRCGAVRF